MSGYQDIAPGEYEEFTHGWTQAAAAAGAPAGGSPCVTGPQRGKHRPVRGGKGRADLGQHDRRPARVPAGDHAVVHVGALEGHRFVARPPTPAPAPCSTRPPTSRRPAPATPTPWTGGRTTGTADRPGLLRYDNPACRCARWGARSDFLRPGGARLDPFLGAGTVAVACWRTGRSFTGGDVNINAVRFAAARQQPNTPGQKTSEAKPCSRQRPWAARMLRRSHTRPVTSCR